MNNIVLIGMPGTGKSTVGVILAKRLGYDFVDTDLLIIRRAGKTLPAILEDAGVDGFLSLEEDVGKDLHCEHTVIATGGSMVLSGNAMENLGRQSIVIWLDTEIAEIERRITRSKDRGIAADKNATIAEIYEARRPLYRKYADLTILCVMGTDRVVNKVMEGIEGFGKTACP